MFTQFPVLAQGLAEILTPQSESSSSSEPEILGEVVEKREECVKHFRMSDGSMTAIVYSEPVHYKDGDKFREIDNTLIIDGKEYKNTDNSFKVKVSKEFKDKKLVTLNSEGHELSWGYVKRNRKLKKDEPLPQDKSEKTVTHTIDPKIVSEENPETESGVKEKTSEIQVESKTAKEENSDGKWKEKIALNYQPEDVEIENFNKKSRLLRNSKEEKTDVSKVCSKAKYKKADPEIDIDYTLSGLGLKENIIINKKLEFSENDSFDFEFQTNDLKIEKDNDGSLKFKDKNGQTVFVMPKSSMWDSGGNYSNDVDYKFTETNAGYVISVIPNFDWINSKDRLFPIFIDPSLTVEVKEGIKSCEIGTPYTDTNLGTSHNLGVGFMEWQSSHWKSYIKCKALPNLMHGEIVTNVQLKLKSYSGQGAYDVTPDNQLAAKKVLESWEEINDLQNGKIGITWNNQPKVDTTVSDYVITSAGTMGLWHSWDITKMAKEWYRLDNPNENNGVEISSLLPSDHFAGVRFISTVNTTYPDDKPYFQISYRNFIGEEPYWSYTNHAVGLKGVGRVNNYAGTLSLSENVLSYSGLRNPVSITNTYNNSSYNLQANTKFHLQEIPGGYPHSSLTGQGWTLDFNRMIYPIPQNNDDMYGQGYRYLYIDGDGTWHYFKETQITQKDENGNDSTVTKIIDEDGLSFEIKTSGSNLEIVDKSDNKLTFSKVYSSDTCFSLVSSQDSDLNTTNYYYEYQPNTPNSKISRIVDAAGRETLLSYEQNGMVSQITEADGSKITFLYDGEKLKEVTYPDGLKTGYDYDEHGRLQRVWTNAGSGSSIRYKYASNSPKSTNFFKIRSVTEYGSQNSDLKSEGNSVHFDYRINQTNIINKTSNLDVNYHENTEIWQFDHDGLVTAVIDENGNMISNYYENSTDGRKYKIKHSNGCGKYTNNLLKNSDARRDLKDWAIKNWNQNENSANSSVATSTETASLGQKCFKISQEGSSNLNWPVAEQKVSIPKSNHDKKYTFSADVKVIGELEDGSGAALHLAVFKGEIQTSGDNYSEWIKNTDGDWRRISVTIDVPAGSDSIKCYFGVKESSGTAYFDCLQLEEGEFASDYNMVENSSFDDGFSNWMRHGLGSADVIQNGRLKMVGDPNVHKAASQDIDINKDNAVLAIRATSQGATVPNLPDSREYYLGYELTFEDDYRIWVKTRFNPDVDDMQCVYASVVANEYHYGVKLKSIRIEVDLQNNCNTVYFDNIQACIDDHGSSCERNENADVVKITDNTGKDTKIERTSHHEAKKITSSNGDVIENVYNDENGFNVSRSKQEELRPHRLLSSSLPIAGNRKVKSDFTYDDYGNVLASKFSAEASSRAANETKSINSVTEYTLSGNYTSKYTDSRGKSTIFNYDENNGNLKSITNPKNVTVNYTYDTVGRMLSSNYGNAQTNYLYSNGSISSIAHSAGVGASVTYNFARDMFGKITGTKVGNQLLLENVYDSGNGLLKQTKYNNNQQIRYSYDKSARLTKKQCLNGKGKSDFEYTYNNKNRPVKTFDSENNLETKIEYDLYGRVVHTRRSDGVSSDIKYNNQTGSLVDKVTSKIFEIKQVLENTFGPSNMLENSKITVQNSSVCSKYGYDELGRTASNEVLNSGEISGIKHEISYVDAEGQNTTNLVNSIELKKKVLGEWINIDSNKKFSYIYDDLDNITDIKDSNDNLIVHYEYDDLGQLTRENNNNLGKTITYSYDSGGNIKEKKIYVYTDGDLTSIVPEKTVEYRYDDPNWKDKLTSYNDGQANHEIIYDGIGNPLVYRDGWKFEWTRGRSLEKALNSCYDINYKYDGAGIRTCKTVNGVTTKFVTSGIQVLAQRTGDDVITWQIDGNGIVVGFNRGGTQYFYLKNVQGDVIGITDTSGNVVASYTYDSWGKLISITDADGNDRTSDSTHIGYINPIRYRGYYYDSETELYYLNARYYDPEIGRFISVDDNLEGGLNLFAYCYNDPVNMVDYDGEDAILLIDKNAAKGFGHMGIAIEYNGKWYHFYYGCQPGGELQSAIGMGGTKAELWEFEFGKDVPKDHNGINSIMIAKNKMKFINGKLQNVKEKLYDGLYTDSRYLSGDFSASYEHIVNNVTLGKTTYNAVTYNCKHASLEALSKGTFTNNDKEYKELINEVKKKIQPNNAFGSFTTSHDGGFK